MSNNNEKGKAAAILGATGGLGRATALRIAKRCPVVVGYHTAEQKAVSLVREIRDAGGQATAFQVDLTQESSIERFFKQANQQWIGLSAIVTATGPALPLGNVVDISEADFRKTYETDVFGLFRVLKHGAATLKASGGGAIVLTATTASLRVLEGDGMSAGPKGAAVLLMKQMARELGAANVRINAVGPGIIDAGAVHDVTTISQIGREVVGRCLERTPLGRMGRPEEFAALVDFLASSDASYITGQLIAVDGGYSL